MVKKAKKEYTYPEGAHLTDRLQIALGKYLYVDDQGCYHNECLAQDLELINKKIYGVLKDRTIDTDKGLNDELKRIISKSISTTNPRLKELKNELNAILDLPNSKSSESRFLNSTLTPDPEILQQSSFGEEIKDDDNFFKIADKTVGRMGGFFAMRRIITTPNSVECDLSPYIIKVFNQHNKRVGEDFITSFVNAFGLGPKFIKTTLTGEKDGVVCRTIAVKMIPNAVPRFVWEQGGRIVSKSKSRVEKRKSIWQLFTSQKQHPEQGKAKYVVEYLFLSTLLGNNDVKGENIILKKDKYDNVEELYVVDWDVWTESDACNVVQQYFGLLVSAIKERDYKEIREVLSFKKMSMIYEKLTTYINQDSDLKGKFIEKLDKETREFLKLDGKNDGETLRNAHISFANIGTLLDSSLDSSATNDVNFFYNLLLKIPDEEILSAIKGLVETKQQDLKRITDKFIDRAEIGVSIAINEKPETKEEVKKKYKEYSDKVIELLDSAKQALDLLPEKKKHVKPMGVTPEVILVESEEMRNVPQIPSSPVEIPIPTPLTKSANPLQQIFCSKQYIAELKETSRWKQVCESKGKILYNIKFNDGFNGKNDFSFVSNHDTGDNNEVIYQEAESAINKAIHKLFIEEEGRFNRVKSEMLKIKVDDKSNQSVLNLKQIFEEGSSLGNDLEHKKAILIFIVENAKSSDGGFKRSDILNELPERLQRDLKHISARMQRYNKENDLFAPFDDNVMRPVGTRSGRMLVKSIENYNPRDAVAKNAISQVCKYYQGR